MSKIRKKSSIMSDLSLGLGLGLGLGIPCCCCFIGHCIFAIICGLLDEFYPNKKRVRSSSSTQQISTNRQAQQVDSINNQKLHINPLNANPRVIRKIMEKFLVQILLMKTNFIWPLTSLFKWTIKICKLYTYGKDPKCISNLSTF